MKSKKIYVREYFVSIGLKNESKKQFFVDNRKFIFLPWFQAAQTSYQYKPYQGKEWEIKEENNFWRDFFY